eukprot:gene26187-11913_t
MFINNVQVSAGQYSNISYINTPASAPQEYPPIADSYLVYKLTQMGIYNGTIDVSIQLYEGPCGTVKKFLPNGLLWYSVFNGQDLRNNCCGTGALTTA